MARQIRTVSSGTIPKIDGAVRALKDAQIGKRGGAVGLDSRELAAEFVLVYEARTENVELWAVTG